MQCGKSIFTLFLQDESSRKPQLSWSEVLRNERTWLSETKQIFCCSLCCNEVTLDRVFSKVSELPSDGWHELFEPSAWCHSEVEQIFDKQRWGGCTNTSLVLFLHMTKSMCIAVQLRKFFFHNSQLHNKRLLEKSQNPREIRTCSLPIARHKC